MKIKNIRVAARGYSYIIDLNDPTIGEFDPSSCEFVA